MLQELAELLVRIAKLFLEKMNLDIPSSDTDLFETAVLDSMAFVQLLVLLEEEFGIRVSLDEVELDHFRSIEAIATLVARELAPRDQNIARFVAGTRRLRAV